MKKKFILYLSSVPLLFACASTSVKEEVFDVITTTTYSNDYDSYERLIKVSIQTERMQNINGIDVLTDQETSLRRYNYLENDICEMIETSDLSPNEVHIEKTGKRFNEYISIENGVDTVSYRLCQYADDKRNKMQYLREKVSYIHPVNREKYFYYDKDGNINKEETRDFATGDIHTTDFQLNIDCVKKYRNSDKEIEEEFDADNNLTSRITTYSEGGYDIEVTEVIALQSIDSIYTKNQHEVRNVSITSDSKSITTFEYDNKGNIVKMIEKIKFYTSENQGTTKEETLKHIRENGDTVSIDSLINIFAI